MPLPLGAHPHPLEHALPRGAPPRHVGLTRPHQVELIPATWGTPLLLGLIPHLVELGPAMWSSFPHPMEHAPAALRTPSPHRRAHPPHHAGLIPTTRSKPLPHVAHSPSHGAHPCPHGACPAPKGISPTPGSTLPPREAHPATWGSFPTPESLPLPCEPIPHLMGAHPLSWELVPTTRISSTAGHLSASKW